MIQDSKTDVFLPKFTCLIKIDLSLIKFLHVLISVIKDSKTDVFLPKFTCPFKIDLSLIIFLRVINGPIKDDPRLQDACIFIFT